MTAPLTSTYDAAFFEARATPEKLRQAVAVARSIRAALPQVDSALDVGAGAFALVNALLGAGVECVAGIEGSGFPLLYAWDRAAAYLYDLRKPVDLGREFDLVMSFEVAEHIEPEFEHVYLENVTRHVGGTLLFSAAAPGQGGHSHVNEQPQAYWAKRFTDAGLCLAHELRARLRAEWGKERASPWYVENLLVFRKPEAA